MKKIIAGIAALALITGAALAQVPAKFLTTLIGTEQVNVLVPSTGTITTSPQITTITSSNLRDTSGYQLVTQAATNVLTANNNKVVLMPMEATSILGSLSGIGAIAREVFGDNSDGAAPQPPRPRPGAPRTTPSINPLPPRES